MLIFKYTVLEEDSQTRHWTLSRLIVTITDKMVALIFLSFHKEESSSEAFSNLQKLTKLTSEEAGL